MKTAFIAGIDSAIGLSIAERLAAGNWSILGSSRRKIDSSSVNKFHCDFESAESIDNCASAIIEQVVSLDLVVVCVGKLSPIGLFEKNQSDEWETSFYVNCLGPLRIIRNLLPLLKNSTHPTVLVFAGGGINSAPISYSSYTLSKVALTKAMELLSAENQSINFVSLGTGWINSPIHRQTIEAGQESGDNLIELERRLKNNDFHPIEKVADFLEWILDDRSFLVSGRNFSLVHDNWGTSQIIRRLKDDPDMFKLRRRGNG